MERGLKGVVEFLWSDAGFSKLPTLALNEDQAIQINREIDIQ